MIPILTERPLFKTGDSLAVTLPKPWLKRFNLKRGDLVEIVGNNDDLVIKVKKGAKI